MEDGLSNTKGFGDYVHHALPDDFDVIGSGFFVQLALGQLVQQHAEFGVGVFAPCEGFKVTVSILELLLPVKRAGFTRRGLQEGQGVSRVFGFEQPRFDRGTNLCLWVLGFVQRAH